MGILDGILSNIPGIRSAWKALKDTIEPESKNIGEMQSVSSSNLAAAMWEDETLSIAFNDGKVYEYYGVPEHVFQSLLAAGSKGSYFYNNIRLSFSYKRVS